MSIRAQNFDSQQGERLHADTKILPDGYQVTMAQSGHVLPLNENREITHYNVLHRENVERRKQEVIL